MRELTRREWRSEIDASTRVAPVYMQICMCIFLLFFSPGFASCECKIYSITSRSVAIHDVPTEVLRISCRPRRDPTGWPDGVPNSPILTRCPPDLVSVADLTQDSRCVSTRPSIQPFVAPSHTRFIQEKHLYYQLLAMLLKYFVARRFVRTRSWLLNKSPHNRRSTNYVHDTKVFS